MKNKKCIIGVLIFSLILGCTNVSNSSAKSKTRISRKKISLAYNGSTTIRIISPTKKVKWSVSSKKYVTITKKGKKNSYCKIKAKGNTNRHVVYVTAKVGKKKYKCKVTIKAKKKKITTPTTSKEMFNSLKNYLKTCKKNNDGEYEYSYEVKDSDYSSEYSDTYVYAISYSEYQECFYFRETVINDEGINSELVFKINYYYLDIAEISFIYYLLDNETATLMLNENISNIKSNSEYDWILGDDQAVLYADSLKNIGNMSITLGIIYWNKMIKNASLGFDLEDMGFGKEKQTQTDMSDPSPSSEPVSTPTVEKDNVYYKTRNKYYESLIKLINTNKLPDNTQFTTFEGESVDDGEENKYSICDIDNDGKEELILSLGGTYTYAMIGQIYGYDAEKDELYSELSNAGPSDLWKVYTNGVITDPFIHKYDISGTLDFWGYYMYTYDDSNDRFNRKYELLAWDGSIYEEDYSGKKFPASIDKDNNKAVYSYSTNGNNISWLDDKDYNNWFNNQIGSGSTLNITFNRINYNDIMSKNNEINSKL